MKHRTPDPGRRRVLFALGGAAAVCAWPGVASGEAPAAISRPIASSGELLPAVGVGSWITFNVGSAPAAQAPLVSVLQTFFDRGGAMIDSSPMYGTSESVIGYLLPNTSRHSHLFSATKIWTFGKVAGEARAHGDVLVWCSGNRLTKSSRQTAPCCVARLAGYPTLSRLAPCPARFSRDFA